MKKQTPDREPEHRSAADSTVSAGPLATSGASVGAYALRELIGSGGMGEVWKAEQTKPVRRVVAIKLIKPGMDSREVLARFAAERQALALMDHPCIAKVYEAGTTNLGRPYFVMEYVRGVPVTEYCDKRRLGIPERLALFQKVCEAVQHAHQKAVIHRDIKPANILVADIDGRPMPKIIDFGVAKATSHRLSELTVHTAMGQLIGTPEYMSPEQAELTGEDVDTRTDVYSLGVVLYELLVGAPPFDAKDLRRAGFAGVVRMLREQDPPRPSTRLSSLGERTTRIASSRRTVPRQLTSRLRGDLDWIVMRSLEKDRNRRYGSPQELAQDVARHLKNEPVLAGPPSTLYRAGKFIRRNKWGVSVACAGIVLLLGFAGTTTLQAQRIAAERDRANREAAASARVSDFLIEMLESVNPGRFGNTLVDNLSSRVVASHSQRGATAVQADSAAITFERSLAGVNRADVARTIIDEEILSRAAATIKGELKEEPLITARLHHVIAASYFRIGIYDKAEEHARQALEIRERVLGQDDPVALSSRQQLAGIYQQTFRPELNAEVSQEVIDALMQTVGLENEQTVRSIAGLAGAYHDMGRLAESDSLYQLALRLQNELKGPNDTRTLRYMHLSGDLADHHGRSAEAESLYTLAIALDKEILGEGHPQTNAARNFYSWLLRDQDRYDEAEQLLIEIFAHSEKEQGARHQRTLWNKWELGRFYADRGRLAEADSILQEALDACRQVLAPSNLTTLNCYKTLAEIYLQSGQAQSKRRFFDEMVVVFRAAAMSEGVSASKRIDHAAALLELVPPAFVAPELPLQMIQAAEVDAGSLNVRQLRSLARAYYRAGEIELAVKTQGYAITRAGADSVVPDLEEELQEFQEAAVGRDH